MKYLPLLLLWLSVLTLAPTAQAEAVSVLPAAPAQTLPLPAPNAEAPIGSHDNLDAPLPPPPPSPAPLTAANPIAPQSSTPALPAAPLVADRSVQPPTSPDRPPLSPPTADPIGTLSFALSVPPSSSSSLPGSSAPSLPGSPAPPPPSSSSSPLPGSLAPLDALFTGNENSLVAKAVGAAEGTRAPNGDRNPAYYGHTDPGNGVWNLGSFSYQHAALSPEDADAKQLARLRKQADQILQKATDKGLSLTVTEKLNGIDLANQAPLAALGEQGYVDWLAVAKAEGKPETDAVLSARVRSFINPKTQRWDAPGLGNTEERITHDQARRMAAIERAILANPQQIQIAQVEPSSSGESQLLAQQPADPFSPIAPQLPAEVIVPTSSETPIAANATHLKQPETIAEAPNTDFILNLNL